MTRALKTNQVDGRDTLREMLSRLQDETRRRIKDLRRDQEEESDRDPADEMDLASTTEEIETHAGLIARAEEKLRYLDEAMTRLEAGKYGRCLKCGGAIPVERLIAIPFASYCVDCQKKLHHPKSGWGEGTTIAPYDQLWTPPQEMKEPVDHDYRSTDPEQQSAIRPQETATDSSTEAKRRPRRKKPTFERKK